MSARQPTNSFLLTCKSSDRLHELSSQLPDILRESLSPSSLSLPLSLPPAAIAAAVLNACTVAVRAAWSAGATAVDPYLEPYAELYLEPWAFGPARTMRDALMAQARSAQGHYAAGVQGHPRDWSQYQYRQSQTGTAGGGSHHPLLAPVLSLALLFLVSLLLFRLLTYTVRFVLGSLRLAFVIVCWTAVIGVGLYAYMFGWEAAAVDVGKVAGVLYGVVTETLRLALAPPPAERGRG